MRIDINHITKYEFSHPSRMVIQTLRLTPQNNSMQNVLSWDISVDCDAKLSAFRDAYGNSCHMLSIDGPVDGFTIETIGSVDTYDNSGLVDDYGTIPLGVYKRLTPLTETTPAMIKFIKDIAVEETNLGKVHQLLSAIHGEMKYETGATDAQTNAAKAFENGKGVCQDFAHIFIAASRYLGIPSRYVSGHLLRQDGAVLQEASHAWAESYVDGLGWIAFDPANGICADEHYVKVAIGLDYHDAAPVTGARFGGGHEVLSVGLNVRKANVQSFSQSQ